MVVEAERVMRLAEVWIAGDRLAIFLDSLFDAIGALQNQAALEVDQRFLSLKLVEHVRLS